MRATTILAIVAIVVALGAVTSLIPIHQVNADRGRANPHPNDNALQNACANPSNSRPGIPFC